MVQVRELPVERKFAIQGGHWVLLYFSISFSFSSENQLQEQCTHQILDNSWTGNLDFSKKSLAIAPERDGQQDEDVMSEIIISRKTWPFVSPSDLPGKFPVSCSTVAHVLRTFLRLSRKNLFPYSQTTTQETKLTIDFAIQVGLHGLELVHVVIPLLFRHRPHVVDRFRFGTDWRRLCLVVREMSPLVFLWLTIQQCCKIFREMFALSTRKILER